MQVAVQGMSSYYKVGELSIFKEENMLEIYQDFFQWLMLKKYTNYRIRVNCGFKKVETRI
jgi:hypothetical protein